MDIFWRFKESDNMIHCVLQIKLKTQKYLTSTSTKGKSHNMSTYDEDILSKPFWLYIC